MFSHATAYGALAIVGFAIVAQLTEGRLDTLIAESPLVTLGAALGIGAFVEIVGGSLIGVAHKGVRYSAWRTDVAGSLSETKHLEALFRQRIGFSPPRGVSVQRQVDYFTTEYVFRASAPATLQTWLADEESRQTAFDLGAATLILSLSLGLFFGAETPSLLEGFVLAAIYAGLLLLIAVEGTLAGPNWRRLGDIMKENYLREQVRQQASRSTVDG